MLALSSCVKSNTDQIKPVMIHMKHWCDTFLINHSFFAEIILSYTYGHMKSYILMRRSYNIRINDTEISEYQVNFSGISSTEWQTSKDISFKIEGTG